MDEFELLVCVRSFYYNTIGDIRNVKKQTCNRLIHINATFANC